MKQIVAAGGEYGAVTSIFAKIALNFDLVLLVLGETIAFLAICWFIRKVLASLVVIP